MSKARPHSRAWRDRCDGFTIVELMIAATLSLVVLAAAFSAFLFLAKGSFRLGQYTDMEGDARSALQRFSLDARQASAASWVSANTLNLTVDGSTITYSYASATRTFSRSADAASPVILVSNIKTFSFSAYQLSGAELPLSTSLSSASAAVKMIQINLGLEQRSSSTGETSTQIISSRCVLRNKKFS